MYELMRSLVFVHTCVVEIVHTYDHYKDNKRT
jgi:hypothetical protein